MRLWNPTSQPAPLWGLSSHWAAPAHPASAGPRADQAMTEAGSSSPHLALGSHCPGALTPQPDSLTNSSCPEIQEGAWPSPHDYHSLARPHRQQELLKCQTLCSSLGTKGQVQTSDLCANCQEAPGLGTVLLWPRPLASGQRGRHQVEGVSRRECRTLLCGPVPRRTGPHPHAARLTMKERRA